MQDGFPNCFLLSCKAKQEVVMIHQSTSRWLRLLTFVFTGGQHPVQLLLVVLDQELLTRSDCSCRRKKKKELVDESEAGRSQVGGVLLSSSHLPHADS